MQLIEIHIRVPTSSRDHHPGVDRWSPEFTNRIMDKGGFIICPPNYGPYIHGCKEYLVLAGLGIHLNVDNFLRFPRGVRWGLQVDCLHRAVT